MKKSKKLSTKKLKQEIISNNILNHKLANLQGKIIYFIKIFCYSTTKCDYIEEIWVVCQADFKNNEYVVDLDWNSKSKTNSKHYGTKHTFHANCLQEWLNSNFTCPSWRTNPTIIYRNKLKESKFQYFKENPHKIYAEDIRDYISTINEFFTDLAQNEDLNYSNEESNNINLPSINRNEQRLQNIGNIESNEPLNSRSERKEYNSSGINNSEELDNESEEESSDNLSESAN